MRKLFGRKRDEPQRDYSTIFRSVRTRRRRVLGRRWHWIVLGALLVAGAAGGFAAWFYYDLQGDIQRGGPDIPQIADDEKDEPFNALLVGSDSREGLTEEEQERLGARPVPGERADTLILAHVDPETERVTMVQFPRDLYVSMPGGGHNRINSALEQGPRRMVRAVEHVTDLDIHHYVEVNIAGFRDVVNAIGGVEVCITEPIPFDEQTGFEVTEDDLGMVHFDGEEALRFVRTRKTLPRGDFDRIQNQQRFLAAAIDKALSTGTLLNPIRLSELKDAAGQNITTGKNTTLLGLRDLAERFRSFDPERYEAYTVPNLGPTEVGAASVVEPDDRAMRVMFDAIAENRSPDDADGVPNVDPSTVRVGVYNATRRDGVAARVSRRLRDALRTDRGTVEIAEVGNARRSGRRGVVIRHGPGGRDEALLVAGAIPDARVERGRVRRGVDVAVIVNGRARIRPVVQIVPLELPESADVPAECRR